jgi:tetratricopeptide (TPR) repeat protein
VEQGYQILTSETRERVHLAGDSFQQAAGRDPTFVPAFIGLFHVRIMEDSEFGAQSAESISNVLAAARALIKVAPGFAEARIAASWIKASDENLYGALVDAQAATKLRPGSKQGGALVHMLYGHYLMRAFDPEAALQEYLLAQKAAPADPNIQWQLGQAYAVKGELSKAIEHYQKSIELEPRQMWGHYLQARVYEEMKEFEKAIRENELGDEQSGRTDRRSLYQELRHSVTEGLSESYWSTKRKHAHDYDDIAECLVHLEGRTSDAYDWLEKARQKGELKGPGPLFAEICWDRNDSRFKEIVRKMNVLAPGPGN